MQITIINTVARMTLLVKISDVASFICPLPEIVMVDFNNSVRHIMPMQCLYKYPMKPLRFALCLEF
jgi:hypothetical protein